MYGKYHITITAADNGTFVEASNNLGEECNRIVGLDADLGEIIVDMCGEMDSVDGGPGYCDGAGCPQCDGEGCE